jgi:hypothetical protein
VSKIGKNPQQVSPQDQAAAIAQARENEDAQPTPADITSEQTRTKDAPAQYPTHKPGQ